MTRAACRRIAGVLVAVAAVLSAASPSSAKAATLSLSPASGPGGATISAGGGGFGSSCGVRLEWETVDGQFLLTLGQAEIGGGSFTTEVVIPDQRDLGAHVVRAKGLAVDRAGRCSAPSGQDAAAAFTLVAAPPPPVANLTLSSATVNPGGLVKLDASGSTGQIKLFQFDLDGNGSFETKCGGLSSAGVVNTTAGQTLVGVQAVGPSGAKDTAQLAVNVAGNPAPGPPKPGGGGNFGLIGSNSAAGTCGEPGQSVSDFFYKAYVCPGMVKAGVAVATIPPELEGDPCFERIDTNGANSRWRSQSSTVVLNGLRLDALGDRLLVYDKLKRVSVDGSKKAKLKVSKPGFDTAVTTGIFKPQWDVSKPATVGTIPVAQFLGFGTFLGLPFSAKDSPLRLDAAGGASFDLFVQLPLPQLLFKSNPSANPLTVKVNATDGIEIDGTYTLAINDVNVGVFKLSGMSVTYERQGNSDFWGGGLTLEFPASGVTAGGQIAVRDGVLEKVRADVNPGPPGIGPIGCCVFVVNFGGELTANAISADATFAAGPDVFGNRAAQAKGTVTIFYEPFELLLTADDLDVVSIDINATAQVSATLDSFSAKGTVNQDFGPFSYNGSLGAKVYSATQWGAGGGGDGCISLIIDACVGVQVSLGAKGIAACGSVSVPILPDPAGGAVVYWSGGFDAFTGCYWEKVKSKAGASAIAASRAADPEAGTAAKPFTVRVPRGVNRGLFAIRGQGGPPQVRLRGPGFPAIDTPPAGTSTARGARWFASRATADNTTYVMVGRPRGGRWKVTQLPGSAAVSSIGFAKGLPGRIARGRVRGKGYRRTLAYRVNKAPGTRVTFLERGGPETPTGPGQRVEQKIGAARRAQGTIGFRPAEARTRARRIDAVIEADGVEIRTETVTRFRAPKFGRLAAPKVTVTRKGSSMRVRWSRIGAARAYRAVVDLSDRATRSFETSRKRLGLRVGGIGPLSSALVEVRAISPGGYLSRGGFGRLKRIPALRVDRSPSVKQVLASNGVAARCAASGDGACTVEVRKGKRLLATGSRPVAHGQVVRVLARLTKAGRRALRGSGALRVELTAEVPGEVTSPVRVRIGR